MVGAGIDVSARTLHVVVLSDEALAMKWPAADPRGLADELHAHEVTRVAIDAPADMSAGHHAGDEKLGAKFRAARCGEVALGRERGIWVAWVPPVRPAGTTFTPAAAWMETGFSIFDACRRSGLDAIETYPYAVFRTLAHGARLAKKTTAAGKAERVRLLHARGVSVGIEELATWSHDALDALAAALVAADPAAVPVTCGHDDSAIWLPSPV